MCPLCVNLNLMLRSEHLLNVYVIYIIYYIYLIYFKVIIIYHCPSCF